MKSKYKQNSIQIKNEFLIDCGRFLSCWFYFYAFSSFWSLEFCYRVQNMPLHRCAANSNMWIGIIYGLFSLYDINVPIIAFFLCAYCLHKLRNPNVQLLTWIIFCLLLLFLLTVIMWSVFLSLALSCCCTFSCTTRRIVPGWWLKMIFLWGFISLVVVDQFRYALMVQIMGTLQQCSAQLQ